MKALIVVGEGNRADHKPSKHTRERVKKAENIYFGEKPDLVIFSGGGKGISTAESMKYITSIIQNPILEKKSKSTLENALFSYELLKGKKVSKIYLVTSKFHMRRAKFIFEKVFGHMGVEVIGYPSLNRMIGWDELLYSLSEWLKLVYTRWVIF